MGLISRLGNVGSQKHRLRSVQTQYTFRWTYLGFRISKNRLNNVSHSQSVVLMKGVTVRWPIKSKSFSNFRSHPLGIFE